MRRFIGIPVAGLLLLAVAAPVAAGPNVGNFSRSAAIVEGSWSAYDDATQTYREGQLTVSRERGASQATADLFSYTDQLVQCTGENTADNPDDDTFGRIATYTSGTGVSTLTVRRASSSASAGGVLDVSVETYNECTGTDSYEESSLPFSLALTATSRSVKERGRGSFHLPSEFNDHYSYRTTYRLAQGTVGLVETLAVAGVIRKVSWIEHSNG